jgi:hypothetical protein
MSGNDHNEAANLVAQHNGTSPDSRVVEAVRYASGLGESASTAITALKAALGSSEGSAAERENAQTRLAALERERASALRDERLEQEQFGEHANHYFSR